MMPNWSLQRTHRARRAAELGRWAAHLLLATECKIVENHRTYGSAPYTVAVVHGGPGAAGEMAPVARELAHDRGILEPLQTATSLEGQVEELRVTLASYTALPVVLIGFSWGAWLSYIVAARYPALVRKLLLVAAGPETMISHI
jgi:pimeloyl-ACP methyl ester carboxylesterase